jgi:hypothetical protein
MTRRRRRRGAEVEMRCEGATQGMDEVIKEQRREQSTALPLLSGMWVEGEGAALLDQTRAVSENQAFGGEC